MRLLDSFSPACMKGRQKDNCECMEPLQIIYERKEKNMKKVIGVIVVLCILIAVIEDRKEDSPDVDTNQNDFEYGSEGRGVMAPVDWEDGYPCPLCNGEGAVLCRVCDGSGENTIYDSLGSSVLKTFEKPYCEACDGKGAITCGRCHGSGMD